MLFSFARLCFRGKHVTLATDGGVIGGHWKKDPEEVLWFSFLTLAIDM